MGRIINRYIAAIVIACGGLLLSDHTLGAQTPGTTGQQQPGPGAGQLPPGQSACSFGEVRVIDAYKAAAPTQKSKLDEVPAEPSRDVALGDVVAVVIKGKSDSLLNDACRKKVILFLDGHPIKGIKAYPPTDPTGNVWKYTLTRTETSRDTWTILLGRPSFGYRTMTASIGFEDQNPIESDGDMPMLRFQVLSGIWFTLWLLIFIGMIGTFLWCAQNTNILRVGGVGLDPMMGTRGTFSLSKAQGAWWFFAILACYLLIGIVTGDFSTSINSTAIILLGIGAGTVLGAAAVDASKYTDDERAKQQEAAKNLQVEINALQTSIKANEEGLRAQPNDLELSRTLLEQRTKLGNSRAARRKLVGESEGFITDILSDANGINFHRFQMAVWTVVLGIIFIKEVYVNLAMPTFDTSIMGLLGLSAGTYLGLKIPEPTIPASQQKPPTKPAGG